ncbi:amidoligase family protein [Capnocytophaga catalasegens]|uniref:Amidoligase enzyme n=1 Tax=Capnocytophaga catalasegens TaxID=1004260 RepID=A0AAV5AR96_9FLAO|nr:amidoligase family protein [Capnocytophaga catalasegens]GIZ15516.1 hypothetical protein RCZ03_15160 [Capnocytophaga catalasegens]GJM49859.1 hypothetical protein RCZ15_08340 [Capnocytophaga catalasegens]GJM54031.1 hypothetical protein RCZ16_23470 [Capnocytophaga catalasegens]
MQKKITERTFGVEFEFADVNKKAVSLPMGFSWSKEETITNTDGKRSTFSMEYGGEVNSPPLKLCQEDRKLLKSVFENLKEKGGKVTWIQALHVHIYAGDFSLSDLKKVFYLSYYTAPYIQEIAYIDSWK